MTDKRSVDDAANLSARLKRIEDRSAIHDALMRYCRGVDRGLPNLILSAFHDDAIDNHVGTPLPPREAIGGLRVPGWGPRQIHHITNEYVEINGDRALSEAYFIMLVGLDRDGIAHDWFVSGRYVDRFERRADDWRIAYRTVVYDMERFDAPVALDDGFGMVGRLSIAMRGIRGAEDWAVREFGAFSEQVEPHAKG